MGRHLHFHLQREQGLVLLSCWPSSGVVQLKSRWPRLLQGAKGAGSGSLHAKHIKGTSSPCHLETAPRHLAGSKASHGAGGSVVGWGLGGPLPHPATLNMHQARKNKWKCSAFSSAAATLVCIQRAALSSGLKPSPGPRRLCWELPPRAGTFRVWESQCL